MINDYGYAETAIANVKEVAEKREKIIPAAVKRVADALAADKLVNFYKYL